MQERLTCFTSSQSRRRKPVGCECGFSFHFPDHPRLASPYLLFQNTPLSAFVALPNRTNKQQRQQQKPTGLVLDVAPPPSWSASSRLFASPAPSTAPDVSQQLHREPQKERRAVNTMEIDVITQSSEMK